MVEHLTQNILSSRGVDYVQNNIRGHHLKNMQHNGFQKHYMDIWNIAHTSHTSITPPLSSRAIEWPHHCNKDATCCAKAASLGSVEHHTHQWYSYKSSSVESPSLILIGIAYVNMIYNSVVLTCIHKTNWVCFENAWVYVVFGMQNCPSLATRVTGSSLGTNQMKHANVLIFKTVRAT